MAQALRKTEYTKDQLTIGIRLHDDFEYYAKKALKIKPKSKQDGALIPLVFNTAQKYLKWRLDKQMREIGRVRAYVLKGRQQGCSTFIEGDYFHITSMNYGIKTFIQTHSKKATANLYGMAHRYLNNLPDDIRPHVSTSNTTELVFDELDSGYAVSTAGSKETGRSDTIDLLHGSEVAFWNSSLDHTTGLLQAVPDVPGTKIVLESTANGMGGYFHKGYTTAEAGLNGDYIAVFIPWYWQEEYRKSVPEGFELTDAEREYRELYDTYPLFNEDGECTIIKKKIDDEQFMWMRGKIAEFEGDISKFNQEYPPTAEKAFQYTAVKSHIKGELIVAALNRPLYRSYGAIVAGFDPSFTEEGDRKAFIYRQGANMWGLDYPKLNGHPKMVTYLKAKLDATTPYIDRLFIDFGGGGAAIYDDLEADGYEDRVTLVNSGKGAEKDYKYANKRAEMSERFKDALKNEDRPLAVKVDEKFRQAFIIDVTAEGYTEDSVDRILMEKKEKVKDRVGVSPDGSDAAKLTYAEKIIRKHVMGGQVEYVDTGDDLYAI